MSCALISICIPAYNKPDYVRRCLNSISRQTYKNIEVIISDDSPDDSLKHVVSEFSNLAIKYLHNTVPLKSPGNWNNALNNARGEFIMLLHQDDWLSSSDSIQKFVAGFHNDEVDFVFCKNIGLDEMGKKILFQDRAKIPDLQKRPEYLIIRCVIGPPSNVMLRNKITVRYDEELIWLVDVDYYIRIIKGGFKFNYIPEELVTIGIHSDQTTEFVRSNDSIILKENLMVAKKIGDVALTNDIELYDYFWRLIRNFKVKSIDAVEKVGVQKECVLATIKEIIAFQKKFPSTLLKNGFFSKSLMAVKFGGTKLMRLFS